MTIWPARLSKDGTKVLCGRTVDGRQNCTEVLAVIQYGAPWGASVLFHGFYEEARPQEPGEPIYSGPTYLRIGTTLPRSSPTGRPRSGTPWRAPARDRTRQRRDRTRDTLRGLFGTPDATPNATGSTETFRSYDRRTDVRDTPLTRRTSVPEQAGTCTRGERNNTARSASRPGSSAILILAPRIAPSASHQ